MSPECTTRLDRLGRVINRWEAQVRGARWLAAALGWLAALSLTDVLAQVGRAGRGAGASALAALVGIALWRVVRALRRSYTREGVAARVERAFPELDNHLINYVQFTREGGSDPFKAAYVRQGEPAWRGLDFGRLKDRHALRRSGTLLAAVLVLIGILWGSLGPAWGVAMLRMANPLSPREPLTLTRLLTVNPGNATVLQGDALLIEATVNGFAGHSVKLDLDPDDGDRKSVMLGSIDGAGDRTFSHRLPRVNADLRYRVRAGDAPPSAWYEVATRPPPAFTRIAMAMTPPTYTGKDPAVYNALTDECVVYQGARIELDVACNTPLVSAELAPVDGDPVAMARGTGDRDWRGSAVLMAGNGFALRAVDAYGKAFEERIPCQVVPDRAPELEIIAPRGRVRLPPGQPPRIQFTVADDYGLASAEVQEVAGGTEDDTDGVVLRTWNLANEPTYAAVWERDAPIRSGVDVTYRVVVQDNCPFTDRAVRSLPLAFSATSQVDATEQRNQLEQAAAAGLKRVVEMQRENLARTEALRAALDRTTPEHWDETATRQRAIRTTTRELLDNPIQPFGGLANPMKRLYVEEMASAVQVLEQVPDSPAERKEPLAAEAVSLEQRILEALGHADAAAAAAAAQRRTSGLSAMLTALVRGQAEVLKTTGRFVQSGAKVGATLVDAQDVLAEDLSTFVSTCADEADAMRGADEAFAATLDEVGGHCNSLKIRDHMVLAAERLDQNLPADAEPHARQSLQGLQSVQELLEGIALERETEKRTELAGALTDARERLERVRDLRGRMLDSMDAIRGQEDQSEGALEPIEEAYQELARNTRESLLQIPTDLHTFADMQAANDLVEDVFEVFQEIEQVETTQTNDQASAIQLLDFAKEDANLELMDEAIDRIDEIETWLLEKPDEKRVTAEAFDREEMPEEGLVKGDLAEAVQDLIGDLLEEDQAREDEAQDSATTHGVTDMETGWGVEEGETVTFSAKGKTGNRTPDHKEQDGRSNVGRQGMAVGETAAASGTINEGDHNIEARRTEDPAQAGQIDLAGDADARATGGGKKGTGKADDYGMSGGVKRIDSFEQGSWEGMAALMARQADALYAQASLKNVRVDTLHEAAHFLRQAEDAVARGDIEQMREFRHLATAALQQARAQLEAGPSRSIDTGGAGSLIEDVVEGGSDLAPPAYRDQVAEYYRALNEML